MTEINPYEPPQTQSSKQHVPIVRKTTRSKSNLDLQGALAVQLIALAASIASWIASEMSVWGNDIQHSAKIAIVSGSIAAFFGIVIIIAAKKQNKPRWVFFEIMLISILIVCALVRLS